VSKRLEDQLAFIIHCSHENINQERKLESINGNVQLIKFEDLENTNSDNYQPPEVVGDDLAVIMYTSGKIAELTPFFTKIWPKLFFQTSFILKRRNLEITGGCISSIRVFSIIEERFF